MARVFAASLCLALAAATEIKHCKVCHDRVAELKSDIMMVKKQVPHLTPSEEWTKQQAEAVSKAAVQRLTAEGAVLRAETERIETNGATVMMSLTEFRKKLSDMEGSIIAEVDSLHGKMNSSKTRQTELEAAVQENIGKEDEDRGRYVSIQEEMGRLHKRLSPIVLAALNAESEALGTELMYATRMLEKSKVEEVKSLAKKAQVDAEVESQREAARLATEAAQEAMDEGQKELGDALKTATVSKDAAVKLQKGAEDVVAKRCAVAWLKLDSTKEEKEAKCEKINDELSTVNAQKSVLQQTANSQTIAENAAEGEPVE